MQLTICVQLFFLPHEKRVDLRRHIKAMPGRRRCSKDTMWPDNMTVS